MSELTPDRFAEFFTALHGFEPFPWQSRLARTIFESGGRWPELLDLPTASGKTATVEIALYTLAAGLPVPRRIIFVVDRRTIVQQAAQRARLIRDRLDDLDARDEHPVLADVRAGLLACQGAPGRHQEPVPFAVAELRGAVQEDPSWTERPDLPVVAVSTVDQIGSRLLFRGYGISRGMLPIHAGLVGNDALLLLDEVHLSQPFAQLLRRIENRYRPTELPDRWQVTELSATPANSYTQPYTLDEADLAHSVLAQRIEAVKPARLHTVKVPADPQQAESALVAAHVEQVRDLLRDPRVQSVGVVVNRVVRAGVISERLRTVPDVDADIRLVTGRMRGMDRDTVLTEIINRVGSRSSTRCAEYTGTPRKLVVVATQAIEAGADLDFDVIVTDAASLDALIQRFGRVDRVGRFSATLTECGAEIADRPHSVIVGTSRTSGDPDDPVYAQSLARTWEWLSGRSASLDFGIRCQMESFPTGERRQELISRSSEAPILLRSHLDRLVRTSPVPDADVDIATFLHGLDSRPDQDVEVVWRADLAPGMLHAAAADTSPDGADDIGDLITAVPPSPGEAMSVPISRVRQWLANLGRETTPDLSLSDMESSVSQQDREQSKRIRPCVVWRDRKASIVRTGRDLRAGDTVIVPADYGGIADYNWNPAETTPVEDLAEGAGLEVGRFRMRLHPDVIDQAMFGLTVPENRTGPEPSEKERFAARRKWLKRGTIDAQGILVHEGVIPTPEWTNLADADPLEEIGLWLRDRISPPGESADGAADHWLRVAATLGRPGRLRERNIQIVPSAYGPLYVVSEAVKYVAGKGGSSSRIDVDTDPAASQNSGRTYPLNDHLDDVERWVLNTTEALGLPDHIRRTLVRAGALHDIGKADERCQLYLSEGAILPELLAKSAIPRNDRARNERARSQSGYPRGIRHEIASADMLPDQSDVGLDAVLLRYVTGSHHGFGRPFFPAQIDPADTTVEYAWRDRVLSSERPYRHATVGGRLSFDFNDVVARFGVFGAAWLEAILRLGDHCASAEAARAEEV